MARDWGESSSTNFWQELSKPYHRKFDGFIDVKFSDGSYCFCLYKLRSPGSALQATEWMAVDPVAVDPDKKKI